MRMGPGGFTRMMSVGPNGPVLHAGTIGLGPQARMGLPPPPPPPYPGPPPPYPGPAAQVCFNTKQLWFACLVVILILLNNLGTLFVFLSYTCICIHINT